jgi:hypothetical protein
MAFPEILSGKQQLKLDGNFGLMLYWENEVVNEYFEIVELHGRKKANGTSPFAYSVMQEAIYRSHGVARK